MQARKSPIVQYSVPKNREGIKRVRYTGETLTRFLLDNNADPWGYRQFLIDNRVGSVFDLEPGTMVYVRELRTKDRFPRHPNAK